MKNYMIICFLIFIVSSCQQEKAKGMEQKKMLKGVAVINTVDPVCHMKTSESLNDTLVYKGSLYGFCSPECKKEFKGKPETFMVR